MDTLVSISPALEPSNLEIQRINSLPVLVIFPHNRCNCRCVMCDIWRIRETHEITIADLEGHLGSIRKLGVHWVVFSGGEPQLNKKWSELAQLLRSVGLRVTLLTAGLLLESQAQAVVNSVDDVIVSLDGPPAVHDGIRRVRGAFDKLARGVTALRRLRPEIEVRARCTVQKANHTSLRALVKTAKEIDLNSVSFLAADLTSSAFNRADGWTADQRSHIALDSQEVDALQAEMESLIDECQADIESGFVIESAEKLRRIVRHFRAHLNQAPDVAPRCNAPWVSAVIEASGDVRPCFFHPVMGNIRQQSLPEILNSPEALEFRAGLDVATNPVCRKCVCSLYIRQKNSQ